MRREHGSEESYALRHRVSRRMGRVTGGDLDGRVALVSGGGTGIGKAIAAGLAGAGAAVVLTGRRASVLEQAASEIATTGGRVEVAPGDVRSKVPQGTAHGQQQ